MSDDLLMKKRVISNTFAEWILHKLINRVQRNEDKGLSLECYNTFARQEKKSGIMSLFFCFHWGAKDGVF